MGEDQEIATTVPHASFGAPVNLRNYLLFGSVSTNRDDDVESAST
jgi:hypothetical protein